MLNPEDRPALAELQSVTLLQIEPWITSEPRLYQALSRFYRLRMPPWTQAIALAPSPLPRSSPESPPPAPSHDADPSAAVGLDGKPLDADVSVEDHFYYTLGGLDPAAFEETHPGPSPAATASPTPPPLVAPRSPVDPLARLGEAVGDFSALLSQGIIIYDPATAFRSSAGRVERLPFPGNVIPANRISPIAQNYMKYFPSPDQAGDAQGLNNYLSENTRSDDFYALTVRGDHQVTDKQRIFVRWNKNDRREGAAHGLER